MNPMLAAHYALAARAAHKAGASDRRPQPHPRYGQNDREIALTRKNFLFLGSEAGGDRAALLYSVLETAKLNGLDPEAYLADVLDRMAKGHPINRLAELLPWNWTRQADKLAA
ncbi:transposase IS66-like protein [Nitrospirillum viridazoti]|uniref:Transposase IS66-like protein n=1 Tax=Nitrospirillum amazonense TaxID=28077 RepID=A0A560HNT7_9PROT|nr:transposase IS66-like protein [Nitrospirillum amazonense]